MLYAIRGANTAFTEEVEPGDTITICLVHRDGSASGEDSGDSVMVRFKVDSVVNDAM